MSSLIKTQEKGYKETSPHLQKKFDAELNENKKYCRG